MNNKPLRYISAYPDDLIHQVERLIAQNRLGTWLQQRYPSLHEYTSEKALYQYTMALKNRFLKKSPPLSKVVYNPKIHLVKHALGLNATVARQHGNRLKAKNEIHISSLFRQAPEPLLRMLVVHELAHLKEKNHDKAFYALCCHMEPDYHQLELDARLYLTYRELAEQPYHQQESDNDSSH